MIILPSGAFHVDFVARVKYGIGESLERKLHAPHLRFHVSASYPCPLGLSDRLCREIGQVRTLRFSRHRYHYHSPSRSNCGSSSVNERSYRGLFFFLDRIVKHYGHLNDDVLKPLRDLHLENVSKNTDYKFVAILPTNEYLYDAALLHVKLSNPLVGKILDDLPMMLAAHNELANSTEDEMLTKLTAGLASHKLEYDRSGDLEHSSTPQRRFASIHYIVQSNPE